MAQHFQKKDLGQRPKGLMSSWKWSSFSGKTSRHCNHTSLGGKTRKHHEPPTWCGGACCWRLYEVQSGSRVIKCNSWSLSAGQTDGTMLLLLWLRSDTETYWAKKQCPSPGELFSTPALHISTIYLLSIIPPHSPVSLRYCSDGSLAPWDLSRPRPKWFQRATRTSCLRIWRILFT